MVNVIHESVQVARKKYRDDMWEQFYNWVDYGLYNRNDKYKAHKIPFSDLRIIVRIRRGGNGHIIRPGERYERQFNSHDGNTYVFRSKIEFVELERKYKFCEWDY